GGRDVGGHSYQCPLVDLEIPGTGIHRSVDTGGGRSGDPGGDDRAICEREPVSTVRGCALQTFQTPRPSPHPPLPNARTAATTPHVPRRRRSGCITSMRYAPVRCCWASCSIPCCPSSPEGCGCSRTPGQLSGPRRPSSPSTCSGWCCS